MSGSLRRLTPGLVGYLVGFAALSGTTGVDDTLESLERHVQEDEVRPGLSFSERIRRRHLQGRFR